MHLLHSSHASGYKCNVPIGGKSWLTMNSKSKLEQQAIDNMGASENLQQTRNKNKMGGYESKPFMNHLWFMEINDHVDFLHLSCFVGLPLSWLQEFNVYTTKKFNQMIFNYDSFQLDKAIILDKLYWTWVNLINSNFHYHGYDYSIN